MPKTLVLFLHEAKGHPSIRVWLGKLRRRDARALVRARKKTRNALALIARDIGKDPALWRLVDQEVLNSQVARVIYDARTRAKLTQQQLAELAGTTQPVIARLEDADYAGHSLRMLRRIAEALGQRIEIRFVPKRRAW